MQEKVNEIKNTKYKRIWTLKNNLFKNYFNEKWEIKIIFSLIKFKNLKYLKFNTYIFAYIIYIKNGVLIVKV